MKKRIFIITLLILFVAIAVYARNPYNPSPSFPGWQNIVKLFNSGSCSGYLKSDGTCGTAATSVTGLTLGTNATITVSNSVNATITGDFGSAAYLDVGTNANEVVQFDGSGKYPAADGSQITNLDVAHIANVTSWGSSTPSSGYPVINGTGGQVNAATWQLQGTANSTYDLDNMGSSAANITYADLMTGISNSTLKPGSYYRITDFASKHYMFDSAGVQYETNTGATEPLIVFATSTNTLDKQAYSAAYPKDIIYYDPDPNNWLTDLGFAQSGTIVPDFKGVIYFRHDTLQDNYMGYDFRNVKFRRWALDVAAYNAETTYAKDDYAYDGAGKLIYRSLQDANTGNELTAGSAWWVPYATVSATKYLSPSPSADTTNLIPVNAADYQDFLTFAQLTTNGTYEACADGNHFASYKPTAPVSTILANNVFFMAEDALNVPTTISNNIFTGLAAYNTYNPGTTSSVFSKNKIDSWCLYNLFGAGSINSNNLRYVISNTFIGSFLWNVAEYAVAMCIFSDGFTRYRLGPGIMGINFATATRSLDNTYDKELFTIESGDIKLRYYDSGGNLVITDPTN